MEELLRRALLEKDGQKKAGAVLRKRFGPETAGCFLERLPMLRQLCRDDAEAALRSDPAAQSMEEVLSCYPGIYAMQLHRVAHTLWMLGQKLAARQMAEYAHSRTGIDIHPGAQIGGGFFIDHGTGVVIGQTAVIGRNVRLYHAVTLGALSGRDAEKQRNVKRHPTVQDDVVVYAGATVLGGDTVIGKGSTIGANAFVTASVPPGSRVPACAVVLRDEKMSGRISEHLGK